MLMRLPTTNALPAIKELLQTLGQAFDQKKLRQDLLSHPEYPSLLALNEVLQQYGIDNDAVEVEKDKLNELPTPFIAYMKLPPNGKDFALVHKVFNGSVSLVDANAKAQTVSRDSFLNDWQQIALVVDRQRPIAASVSDAPSFWDNKKHLSLVSGVCVSA
jgi:ABC-type bacteriocin/lantibiotic exporter with double-glycine peptidase domain